MVEKREGRGWIKGCALGCVVLVLVGVGILAIIGILQFSASRVVADFTTESKVQRAPRQAATAAQMSDATGQALTLTDSEALKAPVLSAAGGTLNVDFKMGKLVMVPSDSDSFEVVAEYDRNRFRLVEELEENADGTWEYSVTFEPKVRMMGFRKVDNEIEIRVPKGLPMNLVADINMGESEVELGGLSLVSVDLDLRMGQHTVSFSEPTAFSMESFELEGAMGQVDVRDLGNASPAEVDTSHRMGQMTLDLRGDWTNDGAVKARCRMGECTIMSPEDVNVVTDRLSVTMGERSARPRVSEGVADDAPTVRLDVSGSMGEVRIR